VTLLDILVAIARNRRVIAVVACGLTLLGMTYSIIAPYEYTSEAVVVRESQAEAPAGLSDGISALQGFGISLGGVTSGLSPEAYPSILRSREVRLAVARDTFYFADVGRKMTFTEHHQLSSGTIGQILEAIKTYTIGLPGMLIDEESTPSEEVSNRPQVTQLTKEEEEAIGAFEEMMGVSVDSETGLMSISVTASESKLAASIAERFIDHLSERVRTLRTEKARQNLEFIRQRFREAEQELNRAEEQLANFVDRNQNIQSADLRTERDRLQRQVRFKSNLYSELQAKVTQARIDLQKSEPVITVVEGPVAPQNRSAPQRKIITIVSFLFGMILGVGIAIFRAFFLGTAKEEEHDKIREIRDAFTPSSLQDRFNGGATAAQTGSEENM
jgi:uncharacterized protein involved in exopolysaccharide biosynthesis